MTAFIMRLSREMPAKFTPVRSFICSLVAPPFIGDVEARGVVDGDLAGAVDGDSTTGLLCSGPESVSQAAICFTRCDSGGGSRRRRLSVRSRFFGDRTSSIDPAAAWDGELVATAVVVVIHPVADGSIDAIASVYAAEPCSEDVDVESTSAEAVGVVGGCICIIAR